MSNLRRVVCAALVAPLLAGPAWAGKKTRKNDGLLQVVTPVKGEDARAHPHVNVVLLFGSGFDDTPADPSTFQAKLGRQDVTSRFAPLDAGEFEGQPGRRATFEVAELKTGRKSNKLKLSVRSTEYFGKRKPKTFRDKDKIKFRVVDAANQPPTAQAAADSELVLLGIPIQFDGSGSRDPDLDGLQYTWDFGDGTTSNEPMPLHVYEVAGLGDVVVRLTVSDATDSATSELQLAAKPAVDPDRTEGSLALTGSEPLEFGVVALGTTAAKTVTVQNKSNASTSQLKVRMQSTSPVFGLDPAVLDLGPGESADVTVTFAPVTEGHADTRLSLIASSSGRSAVSIIAHGYGGTGHGTGPTSAAQTVFYKTLESTIIEDVVVAIQPDGMRIQVDNSVGGCDAPGLLGVGDACVDDADCAIHGGTCAVSTCVDGANAGAPCQFPTDCPGGNCPTGYRLFVEDVCGDSHGNVFVLSDEGTFTDPQDGLTLRAVTLLRVTIDADGTVTERRILRRLNEETVDIACDDLAAGDVYAPEYFDVDLANCFRTEKQVLTRLRKSDGRPGVIEPQLDAVQGIDSCNDLEDTADAIAASANVRTMFANFQDGGIWRLRPSPLPFLTNVLDNESLGIDADDNLLYAEASDVGTVARLNLYRITPAQVSTGPLPTAAAVPCATVSIPNNGGRTLVLGLAAGPSEDGEGTRVFVAFVTSSVGLSGVLDRTLGVRGTVAFTVRTSDGTCLPGGVVDLEPWEFASF